MPLSINGKAFFQLIIFNKTQFLKIVQKTNVERLSRFCNYSSPIISTPPLAKPQIQAKKLGITKTTIKDTVKTKGGALKGRVYTSQKKAIPTSLPSQISLVPTDSTTASLPAILSLQQTSLNSVLPAQSKGIEFNVPTSLKTNEINLNSTPFVSQTKGSKPVQSVPKKKSSEKGRMWKIAAAVTLLAIAVLGGYQSMMIPPVMSDLAPSPIPHRSFQPFCQWNEQPPKLAEKHDSIYLSRAPCFPEPKPISRAVMVYAPFKDRSQIHVEYPSDLLRKLLTKDELLEEVAKRVENLKSLSEHSVEDNEDVASPLPLPSSSEVQPHTFCPKEFPLLPEQTDNVVINASDQLQPDSTPTVGAIPISSLRVGFGTLVTFAIISWLCVKRKLSVEQNFSDTRIIRSSKKPSSNLISSANRVQRSNHSEGVLTKEGADYYIHAFRKMYFRLVSECKEIPSENYRTFPKFKDTRSHLVSIVNYLSKHVGKAFKTTSIKKEVPDVSNSLLKSWLSEDPKWESTLEDEATLNDSPAKKICDALRKKLNMFEAKEGQTASHIARLCAKLDQLSEMEICAQEALALFYQFMQKISQNFPNSTLFEKLGIGKQDNGESYYKWIRQNIREESPLDLFQKELLEKVGGGGHLKVEEIIEKFNIYVADLKTKGHEEATDTTEHSKFVKRKLAGCNTTKEALEIINKEIEDEAARRKFPKSQLDWQKLNAKFSNIELLTPPMVVSLTPPSTSLVLPSQSQLHDSRVSASQRKNLKKELQKKPKTAQELLKKFKVFLTSFKLSRLKEGENIIHIGLNSFQQEINKMKVSRTIESGLEAIRKKIIKLEKKQETPHIQKFKEEWNILLKRWSFPLIPFLPLMGDDASLYEEETKNDLTALVVYRDASKRN